MDSVKLGTQGLEVSRQGLGCMGMSEFYGTSNEGEAIATIHRAIELGVTFLDTADMYGVGRNEDLVGRAIADRRNRVVIRRHHTVEVRRLVGLRADQRQVRRGLRVEDVVNLVRAVRDAAAEPPPAAEPDGD